MEQKREIGGIALIIIWLFFSFVFALVGKDRKIGYGGALVLCLLTSPILGLIICLCLPKKEEPKPVKEYTCKYCSFKTGENSFYCPRCQRDNEGFTIDENKVRFAKV